MLSAGRSVLSRASRQSASSSSPIAHGKPAIRGPSKLRAMPLTGTYTQRRHIQKQLEMAKEMTMAFWNGGKQLWTNYMKSRALNARKATGEELTRAEQRFMRQTSEDVWKLGPLVLINLLPGSLILLGIYIAAVPGALPSTIQIAAWAEKSLQGAIAGKKEGAQGILEHVHSLVQSTPETNDYDHVLTPEIRTKITTIHGKVVANKYITPSELMPLSRPFETVMDIVEMERPLLIAGSKIVGLAAFRFIPLPFKIARLNRHYAYLAYDDKMVLGLPEGAHSLNDQELLEFLDERGLAAHSLSREQRLQWAEDWLQLAKDPSIVPSVYMLFAACNTNATIPSFTKKVGTSSK